MINYVVIADDLTGANATGVLIKKLNLTPVTIMNSMEKDNLEKNKFDTVLYSTDSRGVDKEEAYCRVYKATELFSNPCVNVYGKRIDSTLRGNLGAEIDGMLDALGDDTVAAVVPVFPDAGRVAVGGYLLVNGIALEETDASKDGKRPINSSVIEKLIKQQTNYEIDSIYLESIKGKKEILKERILELYSKGNRIIVFDALNNNDLEVISEALVDTKIKFICVDPGPFTAATIAQYESLKEESQKNDNKVLMAVGSITNTTRKQLDKVCKELNLLKVDIEVKDILGSLDEKEDEIKRVVNQVIQNKENYDVFCIVLDSIYEEIRIDLDREAKNRNTNKEFLTEIINNSVAEISYRILKNIKDIKGIFSSGGDISISICKKFNSVGLELLSEVIPLAAYGELIGGEFPKMKIVSKGGIVGDINGMKVCVEHLLKAIND